MKICKYLIIRRANGGTWIPDLFLTKETLYPWATSAKKKSERPGSNRRHSAWKADALPTELLSLLLCWYFFSNIYNYIYFIVGRAGFEPAKVKPTDLQSVLVGRLSISPLVKNTLYLNEPMEGLEPTTCWLQISCSSQLSYIGLKFWLQIKC